MISWEEVITVFLIAEAWYQIKTRAKYWWELWRIYDENRYRNMPKDETEHLIRFIHTAKKVSSRKYQQFLLHTFTLGWITFTIWFVSRML